jgi:hypothetical protein
MLQDIVIKMFLLFIWFNKSAAYDNFLDGCLSTKLYLGSTIKLPTTRIYQLRSSIVRYHIHDSTNGKTLKETKNTAPPQML